MSSETGTLEQLNTLIKDYSANKDSYDIKKLQSIRENLSLCLHYLANDFTDSQFLSDSAAYIEKNELAKMRDSLRTVKDEVTNKNYTREQLADLALIKSETFSRAALEAAKEYRRYRLLFETCYQILNSISSRINITR